MICKSDYLDSVNSLADRIDRQIDYIFNGLLVEFVEGEEDKVEYVKCIKSITLLSRSMSSFLKDLKGLRRCQR